jgi:hypothetical protein
LAIKAKAEAITIVACNQYLVAIDGTIKNQLDKCNSMQHSKVKSDLARKTVVNWVAKSMRRMTCKKALQQWETKIANTEATLQAIWSIAKSLMKWYGPKVPTAIHGPFSLTFHPSEKTNAMPTFWKSSWTAGGG